jgi:hypothetical protein
VRSNTSGREKASDDWSVIRRKWIQVIRSYRHHSLLLKPLT